ncbi:MAG: DUF835 domain-containing protein [Candidatus Woesearchaeota archaeon]|nr:DUF835 domain-containing protein [Candidatus Woesearchaeota archaeon]
MKSNRLLIIILLSLVIIGAAIITNLLSFSNIEDLIIEQLKETQQIETEHAASQIESHILQIKDELITLSKFPIKEKIDLNQQCSGDMETIHIGTESKIDSLLRVDESGNVIECSSSEFQNFLGLNIANKDYFKTPKETNEPFITGMVRQGTSRQTIISAPLFETTEYTPYPNFQGKFKGVLMSIIELNTLNSLYLHPITASENMLLLINTNTEETILRSSAIDEFSSIKNNLPELSDGFNTITNIKGYGNTIITSSDLIFGSETWRLIVLTPLKNVGNEVSSVQKRHILSLAFVIIVFITVSISLLSLHKTKEEVQKKLEKTHVTLENLGINIEVEKDKYNQADISLEPKKIYLIKEDEENNAHELFISSLNRGFAGLGIVRDDPRILKKKYNLEKTSLIWLTKTKIEGIPCEASIDNLFELISEFIKKCPKSAVLIDKLNYILTENSFESVIKKIHELKDLTLAHETIIILSVNPDLVEESKLKAIESETIDLYGKHLKERVELSELEMNVLKFVNENNVTNRLVSYKDITIKFNITKPTTRVKIRKLEHLNLLTVNQKGRFKSIKITSAGRRIIG